MSLTSEQIEAIVNEMKAASESGGEDAAWARLQPLLNTQHAQREAAMALLKIVQSEHLSHVHAFEVYQAVENAHPNDDAITIRIGEYLAQAIDIDLLNAPPPDSPFVTRLIDKLQNIVRLKQGSVDEVEALDALSTSARILGRKFDAVAETAFRRLVEIENDSSRHHYNFGLFLKTRGRFAEGMIENKIARDLSPQTIESYQWNFGICATGAGDGESALEAWQKIGQNIEMGRFDLPEGNYSSCKVRLAERPLAERSAESDTPGEEETIWIERLSPCHGIIRSVLFGSLGVDYGDVILFDGAPITYHRYGDRNVPVFPHLATLHHRNYQFFDFAGTQLKSGQLTELNDKLPSDSVIYSHSENFEVLCMDCWSDTKVDHEHSNWREMNVITGQIAAPSGVSPEELLRCIDPLLSGANGCRVFSPNLCEAAGLNERAKFERRRFELLAPRYNPRS